MRKFKTFLGLIIVLCTVYSFSIAATAVDTIDLPITVEEDYTRAQELLKLINERRHELGVMNDLQMDDKLQEISMQRAAELAICCSHNRPDGSGTISVPNIKGENIADGQGIAALVLRDWRGSPLHAVTMQDKYSNYCGIGCVLYEGTRYWVLNTSETAMGSVTSVTGTRMKQHVVTVDKSRIKFAVNNWQISGSESSLHLYYGKSAMPQIVIQNFYPDIDVGIGYICDPGLVTCSGGTPGVASVAANGMVTPENRGTASMTVALTGDPSVKTDISIEVESNILWKNPTIEAITPGPNATAKELCCPKYKVTDCFGNPMVEGRDYYIEYLNNNTQTNPGGRATARIWMMGNYDDPNFEYDFYPQSYKLPEAETNASDTPSEEKAEEPAAKKPAQSNTVKIGKTSITAFRNKTKRKVTVKWKKVKGVSGYQVQYALNKKFSKAKKTKKVGAKKTGLTLTKLKSRKTYFVRIRAYKKVNGMVCYGKWSKIKSVRLK